MLVAHGTERSKGCSACLQTNDPAGFTIVDVAAWGALGEQRWSRAAVAYRAAAPQQRAVAPWTGPSTARAMPLLRGRLCSWRLTTAPQQLTPALLLCCAAQATPLPSTCWRPTA